MKQNILFGGYTRRIGQGIYRMTLDTEKKCLTNLQLIAEEINPTYLAVDQYQHLYSVGAINNAGGIAAFSLNEDRATLLNHVVEEGVSPLCYVAVDETKNLVYGANFHQGVIYVYDRKADGSLKLASSLQHKGNGPSKFQTSPHVHYTDLTPDKRLVVCDLGTDGVYTYDITESRKLIEIAVYQATPGAGARHLTFHPNQKTAYLFGELNSTIEVLDYNKKSGIFSHLQTISTIPENYTGLNGGAAIRLSKDGKFLYASNRGHNSIVTFLVDKNGGNLYSPKWTSTQGDFPRDFNLSKDEDFLIVANQNSDNATLFTRNNKTGSLTLVQQDIFIPEATAVYPL
ncbi:MAG: lactonase family protein [Lactobacillales bacterium]|nr:lactonase family protein [Lactobacillales bacterium]